MLAPMSKVAGRMAIQAGAKYLEMAQGGHGVLLGGVPGVDPGTVMIIGGGDIYSQAIFLADILYLTVVDESPQGETFFPEYSEFSTVLSDEAHEYEGLNYRFLELKR